MTIKFLQDLLISFALVNDHKISTRISEQSIYLLPAFTNQGLLALCVWPLDKQNKSEKCQRQEENNTSACHSS